MSQKSSSNNAQKASFMFDDEPIIKQPRFEVNAPKNDDLWGDDLADDDVEECFQLASQASSQIISEESQKHEIPGTISKETYNHVDLIEFKGQHHHVSSFHLSVNATSTTVQHHKSPLPIANNHSNISKPNKELLSAGSSTKHWEFDDLADDDVEECFQLASQVYSHIGVEGSQEQKDHDAFGSQNSQEVDGSVRKLQHQYSSTQPPVNATSSNVVLERAPSSAFKVPTSIIRPAAKLPLVKSNHCINASIPITGDHREQCAVTAITMQQQSQKLVTTSDKHNIGMQQQQSRSTLLNTLNAENKRLKKMFNEKDGEIYMLRQQLKVCEAKGSGQLKAKIQHYEDKLSVINKELEKAQTLAGFQKLETWKADDNLLMANCNRSIPKAAEVQTNDEESVNDANIKKEYNVDKCEIPSVYFSDGYWLKEIILPDLFTKCDDDLYAAKNETLFSGMQSPYYPKKYTLESCLQSLTELCLVESFESVTPEVLNHLGHIFVMCRKILCSLLVTLRERGRHYVEHDIKSRMKKIQEVEMDPSDNPSIFSPKMWYKIESGIESRRAVGLLGVLSSFSDNMSDLVIGRSKTLSVTCCKTKPTSLASGSLSKNNDGDVPHGTRSVSKQSIKPIETYEDQLFNNADEDCITGEQLISEHNLSDTTSVETSDVELSKNNDCEPFHGAQSVINQSIKPMETDENQLFNNADEDCIIGEQLISEQNLSGTTSVETSDIELSKNNDCEPFHGVQSVINQSIKPMETDENQLFNNADEDCIIGEQLISEQCLSGTTSFNKFDLRTVKCELSQNNDCDPIYGSGSLRNQCIQPLNTGEDQLCFKERECCIKTKQLLGEQSISYTKFKPLSPVDYYLFRGTRAVRYQSIEPMETDERQSCNNANEDEQNLLCTTSFNMPDLVPQQLGESSNLNTVDKTPFVDIPLNKDGCPIQFEDIIKDVFREKIVRWTLWTYEFANPTIDQQELSREGELEIYYENATFGFMKLVRDISHVIAEQAMSSEYSGFLTAVVILLTKIQCDDMVFTDTELCNIIRDILEVIVFSHPALETTVALAEFVEHIAHETEFMNGLCHCPQKIEEEVSSDADLDDLPDPDFCVLQGLCALFEIKRTNLQGRTRISESVVNWMTAAIKCPPHQCPKWALPRSKGEVGSSTCRTAMVETMIFVIYRTFQDFKNEMHSPHGERLRRILARGIMLLYHKLESETEFGYDMQLVEGYYQLLIRGLRNIKDKLRLGKREEKALKLLVAMEESVQPPNMDVEDGRNEDLEDLFTHLDVLLDCEL